jgi:protocatechuate 3,4-dioxygenase beta subunit
MSFEPLSDCTGKTVVAMTEGPYYKAGSPERTNIIDGSPGEKLTLTGFVFNSDCKPIPNAWIDFWQADGGGNYDNSGYKLRGHQFTDSEGKYTLETVIPGEYPGRTPHVHVKVRASETGSTITSQLYFPGAAQNEADSIFDESQLMQVNNAAGGKEATYNFVLPAN